MKLLSKIFKKKPDAMKSFFESEYIYAEVIRNLQIKGGKMSPEQIKDQHSRTITDIESYR